jgi:Putative Ig domain
MNHLIKLLSLTSTVSRSRFSRALAFLGAALFLMMATVLFQPGKRVQAYGRLTINAAEGETFTLPEAKAGSSYEFQFQTEGGLAPLKWSVVAGATPPGLRLEENGKLRGAPSEAKAEAYAFVVEVTDSAKTPQRFSLPCKLLVNAAPLRIVTPATTLRIVSHDNRNPPSAQAVSNNPPGNPADTQIADVSGAGVEPRAAATPPAGPSYDWGRVRAYFTAGVIFSKERESFSKQDLTLGFNVEKTWWQADLEGKFPLKHFNTFFDTRLTTIPIITSSATSSPSAGAQNQPGNNQQCNDFTAGGLDCFLASRKVALMQVGGYAPIYLNFMKWKYQNHHNAVFFAPLARMGIQTITGEEGSRLNIANNNDENNRLNADGVFNFFALGARFGHYKLLDQDTSPELISYLDMTVGKWENFDLIKGQPCDAPANKGAFDCDNGVVKLGGNRLFVRERRFRLGFEGRLKIPETPLFVGFDANLGKGPDDLRFLFGTRFDIGTLFGRLKLLQTTDK